MFTLFGSQARRAKRRERPWQPGTQGSGLKAWAHPFRGSGQTRPCAVVVVRATKPPRKDKRLSGCAGSGAGGTPRAPPSSRKLFGRTPSAKKTTDRFLQRTLLCLQWPRWWRGVAALPVHVITDPSPGPPVVAASAHILDDSDPCCNFDEDSFEDVGGQWHDTSWF